MQRHAGQIDSLRQRLAASELLARVALSPADDGSCIAEASLSAAGHELVATSGAEAARAALDSVAGEGGAAIDWRFSTGGPDPWPDGIRRGEGMLPCTWSWLKSERGHRLLIEVEPDLAWLDGHFPGMPILAGVVQLHWASLLAQGVFSLSAFPRDIVRLKFQRPVLPPALLELELQRVDECNVQFHYRSPGHAHSQGRLLFEAEAP